MSEPQGGKIFQEEIEVTKIYDNLSQEVVKITVDKLRLIHTQYLKDLEEKKGWITPAGILLTLILTFSTTNFKKAVFEAATWEAFFLMAACLTLAWLVVSIQKAIKSKSLDDLIESIKQSNDNSEK